VAEQINTACRDRGFFYIVGHGVDERLFLSLDSLSRQFFALPLEQKLEIAMAKGGRAWRGYFPLGNELTSGKPDQKEGVYFGMERGENDPKVRAGIPLHGRNLFPAQLPAFRQVVLDYIAAMTRLGHALMAGVALSLGMEEGYFAERFSADPTILFRIFHYPARAVDPDSWGVGEHTDYGILTILRQDDVGGLEVKSKTGWVAAPPIPGSFVVNIGDMLDRMTGGYYLSTPHRVKNRTGQGRLSFPFFFDPAFDAEIKPIDFPGRESLIDDREERWDRTSVHTFQGTYGDYLLSKVAKVFPDLYSSSRDH
jgi:isopenicillin N synthase-like dioxygenase